MEDVNLIKSIVGIVGVPFIMAIVQMIKPFIKDTRLYAPISVAVGLVINLCAAYALGSTSSIAWATAAIQGVIAGMAAAGVYSATNQIRKGGIQ